MDKDARSLAMDNVKAESKLQERSIAEGDDEDGTSPIEWDEARYAAALSTLGKIQDQIDTLRSSVPELLQPLMHSDDYSSPQELFDRFSSTVDVACSTLDSLKRDWNDEDTHRIFERARKRNLEEDENKDVSGGVVFQLPQWMMPDPEQIEALERRFGGLEIDQEALDALASGWGRLGDLSGTTGGDGSGGNETSIQDEHFVVEEFARTHQDSASTKRDENSIIVLVEVPTSPEQLLFEISRQDSGSSGQWRYSVVCKDGNRLASSITRCAEKRPQQRNLRYALDMVGAFATEHMKPCKNCGHLLGKEALIPTAMRKDDDSQDAQIWCPYHEECAP